MSNDRPKQQAPERSKQVEELAFSLFSNRTAAANGRAAKQIAIMCFRDAEAFLGVVEDMRSGALVSRQEDVWGDDAFARNLPRNHPCNMISKDQGDRNRVNTIYRWLCQHPGDDVSYREGDLAWDVATTRKARQLFPAYADKTKEELAAIAASH